MLPASAEIRRFWNVPRGILPEELPEASASPILATCERFEGCRNRAGAAIVGAVACICHPVCVRPTPAGRAAIESIHAGLGAFDPRCELFRGRIAASGFLTEDVIQYLRHFRCFAILQLERSQRCSGCIGPIEATDPLRGLGKQLRIFCYNHHRVHARDRLKADHALPQSALARFKHPLKFADHCLRRSRFQRIDAHRLILQPFHIEGRDHVERGLTFCGRALDQQQISGLDDTDSARTRQKAFGRLRHRRSRGVAQRHQRNAEARLPSPDTDGATATRLGHRNDLHQIAGAHNRRVLHSQDAFECRQHVLARDWTGRRERYVALDARVDDEIKLENISEQGLGDRLHIGTLEIHLDAVALEKCGLLQRGGPHLRIAIARPFWLHVRARKQERLIRFCEILRVLPGLPEFPSFATGKRALKSVLRTVSIESAGATLATEAKFAAPQPPSARKVETTKQARVNPTRPHPCNLSTIFSPPWHPIATYTANAREPRVARQENAPSQASQ